MPLGLLLGSVGVSLLLPFSALVLTCLSQCEYLPVLEAILAFSQGNSEGKRYFLYT